MVRYAQIGIYKFWTTDIDEFSIKIDHSDLSFPMNPK